LQEEERIEGACPTVAVFLCRCNGEISHRMDLDKVAERISLLPGVRSVEIHDALCSEEGRAFIRENGGRDSSGRFVIGACSPEVLDAPLTQDLVEAGVNKYLVDQVCLREQCAWVHSDKEAASSKTVALVRGAYRRVVKQEPLEDMTFKVTGATLIIGAGEPGLAAAKRIAASGFSAYTVDETNGIAGDDASQGAAGAGPVEWPSRPSLSDPTPGGNIRLFLMSHVESIEGGVGKWTVRITTPEGVECFDVGTVLISARPSYQASGETTEHAAAAPSDGTRRILRMLHVGRGEDLTIRRLMKGHLPDLNRGIFVLESSMGLDGAIPALDDATSAADASISIMQKGTTSIPRIIARVEEYRCRGCGKCADVCGYDAISLVEREGGIKVAHIDESRCEGCGLCRVACCNGSMALLGYTTTQLLANMMGIIEEMSS
jgi:heterodisulfide reductase subunit A-like polyferredoxin